VTWTRENLQSALNSRFHTLPLPGYRSFIHSPFHSFIHSFFHSYIHLFIRIHHFYRFSYLSRNPVSIIIYNSTKLIIMFFLGSILEDHWEVRIPSSSLGSVYHTERRLSAQDSMRTRSEDSITWLRTQYVKRIKTSWWRWVRTHLNQENWFLELSNSIKYLG